MSNLVLLIFGLLRLKLKFGAQSILSIGRVSKRCVLMNICRTQFFMAEYFNILYIHYWEVSSPRLLIVIWLGFIHSCWWNWRFTVQWLFDCDALLSLNWREISWFTLVSTLKLLRIFCFIWSVNLGAVVWSEIFHFNCACGLFEVWFFLYFNVVIVCHF